MNLAVGTWKTPQGEIIPTHPQEKPRYEFVNPHGFYNLAFLYDKYVELFELANKKPFDALFESQHSKTFLSIKSVFSEDVERPLSKVTVVYFMKEQTMDHNENNDLSSFDVDIPKHTIELLYFHDSMSMTLMSCLNNKLGIPSDPENTLFTIKSMDLIDNQPILFNYDQ